MSVECSKSREGGSGREVKREGAEGMANAQARRRVRGGG